MRFPPTSSGGVRVDPASQTSAKIKYSEKMKVKITIQISVEKGDRKCCETYFLRSKHESNTLFNVSKPVCQFGDQSPYCHLFRTSLRRGENGFIHRCKDCLKSDPKTRNLPDEPEKEIIFGP